ncbi:hypothetical protein FRC01_001723 [Tulasnella sp. 417]|nr:hypothetical protein FRC01_001723 [Tulasnella sp. 417]
MTDSSLVNKAGISSEEIDRLLARSIFGVKTAADPSPAQGEASLCAQSPEPNLPGGPDCLASTSFSSFGEHGNQNTGAPIDGIGSEGSEDQEEVVPANDPSDVFDEVEDASPEDQAFLDELASLEPSLAGLKIREAQSEVARAVIPVLFRNRQEQERLLADTKALLRDIQENPLPKSATGLTTAQKIDALGRARQREYRSQQLNEREKALHEERLEVLAKLEPLVTASGKWLEAHGPKPRQFSPGAGSQGDVQDDSDTSNSHSLESHTSLERSDRSSALDEEQGGIDCEAKEDAVVEEESSGDSDFEDQLRELQSEIQPGSEEQVDEGGSGALG